MAMKTYLLAPNFTFEPDGPIRIGTVIADPFRPTKPLHIPTTAPPTVTHTDFDAAYTREKNQAHHSNIWAQFLQTASANVGAGTSKDVQTQYTMDTLETIRIKNDPTNKEAAELVRHPDIQPTVNAGLIGFAPVYMITGIKIAKGFSLTTRTARTREAQLGASAPITESINAGAELGGSRTVAAEDTARSASDIIFAYQLHVIAQKRWWRSHLTTDVYAPRSAFLGEEGRQQEKEEVAARSVTVEQLMAAADENENHSVKGQTVSEGKDSVICVWFNL
jgi:hypothetical protein